MLPRLQIPQCVCARVFTRRERERKSLRRGGEGRRRDRKREREREIRERVNAKRGGEAGESSAKTRLGVHVSSNTSLSLATREDQARTRSTCLSHCLPTYRPSIRQLSRRAETEQAASRRRRRGASQQPRVIATPARTRRENVNGNARASYPRARSAAFTGAWVYTTPHRWWCGETAGGARNSKGARDGGGENMTDDAECANSRWHRVAGEGTTI